MLPEEDKIVRYYVEQRCSPYRMLEHCSFYLQEEIRMLRRNSILVLLHILVGSWLRK
jgi:hypothetical protein